jgi:hypothetical protein
MKNRGRKVLAEGQHVTCVSAWKLEGWALQKEEGPWGGGAAEQLAGPGARV